MKTAREADLEAIIARQDVEIAALTARLEEATKPAGWEAPLEWKLSPTEARLIELMIRRDHCSRQAIHQELYALDPDGGAEPKIIDVFVCKLRRKLAPFGWTIETLWARGYRLDARQRAAMLAGSVLAP